MRGLPCRACVGFSSLLAGGRQARQPPGLKADLQAAGLPPSSVFLGFLLSLFAQMAGAVRVGSTSREFGSSP